MLHEGVENGVSVTSLILKCEGQLHFCPLLWSPRAPSLPCSLSSLPEWAWEDLVAMGSCLIFPWSHLTPPYLPAFSPLAALASPARISLTWKDLNIWDEVFQNPVSGPPSFSQVVYLMLTTCKCSLVSPWSVPNKADSASLGSGLSNEFCILTPNFCCWVPCYPFGT